jgi:membrane-associated phospholipid phosphatase
MLLLAKLWSVLHSSVAIILALCIAGGCSYSRVYLRYHTPAQVYAGSVLGMGLGAFWYYSFQTKLVRDFLIMVDSTIYELEHYLVMQQKRD